MSNRRRVLQTGIATALLAGSSVARSAFGASYSIPSDWIVIDGTNNSALNRVTIADLKRSGVSG